MSVNIATTNTRRRDLPRGVYRRRRGPNPFVANIVVADRTVYLGSFPTIEAASAAVERAAAARTAAVAARRAARHAENDALVAAMRDKLAAPVAA